MRHKKKKRGKEKNKTKQLKAVQDWLKNNEEKAYAAWNLAVQNKHFDKIDS